MIKEKIYNYYLKKEKPKVYDNNNIHFAPSSFSACKRQIYYKKICEKISNPISEASYLKMDFGNVIHEKIQDLLGNVGAMLECENYKDAELNGLNFKYRLDGILGIENEKYIIEIKTIYARGFKAVEIAPRQDHLLQLALYMLFEGIENGILLYAGRDNGFLLEYELKQHTKLFNELHTKIYDTCHEFKVLATKIKDKIIPIRDYQLQLKNCGDKISETFQKDTVRYKTDWQCSYCGYKNLCWKNELQEIKDNQFYINGEFIK